LFEVIYLNYFPDLMIQRPHQLLKQFARNGYKAVLYNIKGKSRKVIETEENFLIYDGIFPSIPKNGKRVLWISYPPLYKEIGRYQEDLLVYDCVDYPGEEFAHWKRGVDEIREKADVIFVTSDFLYQFNKAYENKTFVCKNGVDFSFFEESSRKERSMPPDIEKAEKPLVGYIGAVAGWIDWKLIQYLASSKKFSIVFAGPFHGINQIPVVSENVHFLGRKDYNALPDYLSFFDVCIIPFRKNKLTDACNPIKMYEYLSLGKPVVATNLEECRIDLVRCSNNYQEFYQNILDSLITQTDEEIRRRINFARENSWEKRGELIRSVLEPLLIRGPI